MLLCSNTALATEYHNNSGTNSYWGHWFDKDIMYIKGAEFCKYYQQCNSENYALSARGLRLESKTYSTTSPNNVNYNISTGWNSSAVYPLLPYIPHHDRWNTKTTLTFVADEQNLAAFKFGGISYYDWGSGCRVEVTGYTLGGQQIVVQDRVRILFDDYYLRQHFSEPLNKVTIAISDCYRGRNNWFDLYKIKITRVEQLPETDTDGDGIPDNVDTDDDNDG
ncbi:MAG: hypothetical protein MJK04_20405, partial [Psychrosphaera sp.]|nr:hypothetical protein [Psychrosphaera sp.]